MKRIQLNKSLFDEQYDVWQTQLRIQEQEPNIFLWQYDICSFLNMSPSCDVYQSILVNVLTLPTDIATEDKLTQL